MNNWGIALIVMMSLDLGIALASHGQPRPKYNFWAALLSVVLIAVVAYKAGAWQLVK